MKIRYFEETDTLQIIFPNASPIETRDLDENTLIDLDAEGHACGITLEKAGNPEIQYERA